MLECFVSRLVEIRQVIRRTDRRGKRGDQTDRQTSEDKRLVGQTDVERQTIRWTDMRGKNR